MGALKVRLDQEGGKLGALENGARGGGESPEKRERGIILLLTGGFQGPKMERHRKWRRFNNLVWWEVRTMGKSYEIAINWTVHGTVEVEAESFAEAVHAAYRAELPQSHSFIEESSWVDVDASKELNAEQIAADVAGGEEI